MSKERIVVDPVTSGTDHANRFLNQLSQELTHRGVSHEVRHHYLEVEGFDFMVVQVGRMRAIRFCGKKFYAGRAPYRYDVSRAADLLTESLPKRKEQKEVWEKRERANKAAALVPRVRGLKVQANHKGELELVFTHPDKATIMAAMDYLAEGGFGDDQCPKHDGVTWVVMGVEDGQTTCHGPFLQWHQACQFIHNHGGVAVELLEPEK